MNLLVDMVWLLMIFIGCLVLFLGVAAIFAVVIPARIRKRIENFHEDE